MKNIRGVSIIAAVFIIVVLAFMGVMFLTFISTGSFTAVNDLQTTQALYVAQGGMEYILRNRPFPNYSMGAGTMALGSGNFTVSSPTYLTADPGNANVTIDVASTEKFPNSGRIVIDSEIISYTGKDATHFTGATRGVGGSSAAAHSTVNASVYPATMVMDNPLLAAATTINVSSNVGFSIPGVIIIDMEYIFCSAVNGTTQFTNCLRGFNSSPQTDHLNASNVFQYSLTSTGTVGNAQRTIERSVASRAPGAMMVYAQANGDGIPYYRQWDGTSWGPELRANAVPASIQYMVLKFARTRNEAILGTLSANGQIWVQVWRDGAWGAAMLLANIGVDADYRGFDIEYETIADRAIIVYNDGTVNPDYRIWDGNVWSGAVNINVPATTGSPNWIEIARHPTTNELAMIVLDSNSDVYGLRWDGGNWIALGGGVWDTQATTATYKAIHVTYEQQSGRALFVWGTRTSSGNQNRYIGYRMWNGAIGTLSNVANQSISNIGNHTARWMRLAPDPYSNHIMLGIQDSGSDLITSLWNGAGWDANGTQHDSSLEDASRNFDLVFETSPVNAGRLWLVWGNSATLSRRQWTGAAWGGISNTGDDTSFVQLIAHPVSGAVLSGIYESRNSGPTNRSIWESHLTQGSAVWSPRVVIWGGRTVAAPVMERVSIAAERRPPPFVVQGWKEIVK
ncbi:MAG: hypothetical protein WC539_05970 [Nitrospirota bacterium]